ncbi:bifunctional diaminohydroxyphosphoribosylaminopyrimidine deaminase/5-amino-6-(5-phosphoribosylamino)uracil reductase RibD [Tuberibacillus sp. Marseille-P3662]|uniref:bifunctional diaminohydroxyphosphoribosylaminopyrimidine deaminase/5-amino-6-(5-phosphoribosylamino)uracil reductase RibD n=1 Tax=Tuberibacillus sp. Marseille-P3662 TaxID=1965358 RepID=UPI0020CB3627|nr:bifunctional diaminohydroxyphosphoribosylaminopyrimidine deaminase/5-amino-6-(5-phosphoribosylamino)uracil reductase RibD [Tuberibacillus sp. Marseille-P3662]
MSDEHYMSLALTLAEQMQGQTNPNPVVGAVVVRAGSIVGLGAHLQAGGPHAEVHALTMAGKQAEGATIYVTLEPCNHYGRTPPCTDLIIKSGIKRAVIATIDPHSKVSGSGITKLRNHGIDVTVGVMEKEAQDANKIFFHYIGQQRPYVTAKMAQSIDGKVATKTGASQWITSKQARDDGHLLRRDHDAILVGIGTVLKDDPTLTNRSSLGGKHPTRIILDRELRIPLNAKVVADRKADTWIFTTEYADQDKWASLSNDEHIKVIDTKAGTIDEVLETLASAEITSLLVEGGPTIMGQFLQGGHVQELIVYTAPKIIGGQAAYTSVAGEGIDLLDNVQTFNHIHTESIGTDTKMIYRQEGI